MITLKNPPQTFEETVRAVVSPPESVQRILVVMPAYNAQRTLAATVADIPRDLVDEILVVDDNSTDGTCEAARQLGLKVIRHAENLGYGGNQKTCYRYALESDADVIVMLHPDYQYDSRVVAVAATLIRLGIVDVVLGSRIRTRSEALQGGMPLVKYVANRVLTTMQNVALGQNLGDFHSGFRVYRRDVLERVNFDANSNDFLFDGQFLVQCVHHGFRLGDIPVPVRYFDAASSINLRRSAVYAIGSLWWIIRFYLHRLRIWKSPVFR
jgi:glycosyltransferase involved in cell wall biosynthesis